MYTTSTGDRHTRQGASAAPTAAPDPSTSATRPPADDLAVAVTGLRCAYGDYEAVRGIDLAAHRGELFAVLGTNGAGKTTTLEALEGRRAPEAGLVRVLGMDPTGSAAAWPPASASCCRNPHCPTSSPRPSSWPCGTK